MKILNSIPTSEFCAIKPHHIGCFGFVGTNSVRKSAFNINISRMFEASCKNISSMLNIFRNIKKNLDNERVKELTIFFCFLR